MGSYYLINNGGSKHGLFRVTAFVNGGQVTGDIGFDTLATTLQFGTTNASDNWRVSAWDERSGFPKTVTAFEDRLIWGGTRTEPDQLWASKTNNFFHVMGQKLDQDSSTNVSLIRYFGPIVDSDPFGFFVSNKDVNQIQWVAGGRSLLIGTRNTEYVADSSGARMGPLNPPFVKAISSYGSNKVRPVPYGNGVLYVSRDGRKVREFTYSEQNGSYISVDVNLLAPEITSFNYDPSAGSIYDQGIIQITFDVNRMVLWAVTSVGSIIGFTYNKEGGVISWSKHSIGGTYTSGQNNKAQVLGVATLPTTEQIYINVFRTINGSDVKFFEIINREFLSLDLINTTTDTPYYLDASERQTINYNVNVTEIYETDVNIATDTLTFVAHGHRKYDKIRFETVNPGVTLPAPLAINTDYFVLKVTDNTFKVCLTEEDVDNNLPINITDVGDDNGATGYYTTVMQSRRTFGTLTHLIGETMGVLADGKVHPDKVVSVNGEITLNYQVTNQIIYGYL